MSNFLLRDPDCVLIHIPKTGGSTIRNGIWGGNYDGPAFGGIPWRWLLRFRFAFVRHPFDRLVSAWVDFTELRGFAGSFDDFVEIVLDDSIIFDECRCTIEEKIRHHTIPQTHPFNNLHLAHRVGRYECFAADLCMILKRVGREPAELPALRKTAHDHWSEYISGSNLRRLTDFYTDDFQRLGYTINAAPGSAD